VRHGIKEIVTASD